ncbi:MAG: hypothetical protein PHF20_01255 [Halothiobacillaceae bacterium]|nr:hypothetical protein [Halothiobacillaceae bacterium]
MRHTKTLSAIAAMILLSLFCIDAIAATGGLQKAQTTTTEVTTQIYAIIGAGVGLYLLYVGFMCKMGRQAWAEFFLAMGHVALVGGSLAAGTYMWSLFAA